VQSVEYVEMSSEVRCEVGGKRVKGSAVCAVRIALSDRERARGGKPVKKCIG
jgi:hypothetical protein